MLFTQPAGVIKCAGAPQKIMWLALDFWKKRGLYSSQDKGNSPIRIQFASGLPTMFGVPRYNATLEALRKERNVDGLFSHNLQSIQGNKATFQVLGGPSDQKPKTKDVHFSMLHAVPPMGPHSFVASSPLANEAGYVHVDEGTLQHKTFPNVWSAGDASSLPTSKTAAAITGQAPILVHNLLRAMAGRPLESSYDGYTSCPIPTEYGKLLLAEFKYQGVPKETCVCMDDPAGKGKWGD